jgi:hypothetical protein
MTIHIIMMMILIFIIIIIIIIIVLRSLSSMCRFASENLPGLVAIYGIV